MARRHRKANEERRGELVVVAVILLVAVIFLSSFSSSSISGKLSLADIFPFLAGKDLGNEEVAAPIASCDNGIKDLKETDVDCGGLCPEQCELSQACEINYDCKSLACDSLLHVCTLPSCDDNAMNGAEAGIDCGGGCYPCHCYNGLLEPVLGEDRIDCSITGSECAPCDADGYPPHCSDNIQNVGEIVGPDCGGSCSFLGRKNPQTCYTHEKACSTANFWWCVRKAKCLPGPLSDCVADKKECEDYGFYWCNLYSTCYDEKSYWCMTDEITCGAEGFFWCEKYNYCIDYKYCNCYTSKEECDADKSCDWTFSGNEYQCLLSSWVPSRAPVATPTS